MQKNEKEEEEGEKTELRKFWISKTENKTECIILGAGSGFITD